MRIKLSCPLLLSEIADAVSGNADISANEKEIHYISTDTRELSGGDVFIALKGEHFDGHRFIGDALRIGAIPISEERTEGGIFVPDTREALFRITRLYKSKLKRLKKTVAVTGSVGKTTTKDFLSEIIGKKFSVSATIGNLNNFLGVCFSVLSAGADTEVLIIEMGMNHIGEISELSEKFKPDLAIITNIGTSHIGNFGSREKIAKAKLEILDGMSNDELIVPYGEPLLFGNGRYSFSTEREQADFFLRGEYGSILFYSGSRLVFGCDFSLKERHFLDCLSPSITAALLLGVAVEDIVKAVEGIGRKSVKQRFINVCGITLYEDLYNASEESIAAALSFINEVKGYEKKSVFLGSVLELGNSAREIHLKIGKNAARYGFERLYFFGDFAEIMKEGALFAGFEPKNIFTFPDRSSHKEAADAVIEHSVKGELILVKGSRAMALEKLSEELTKRNGYA